MMKVNALTLDATEDHAQLVTLEVVLGQYLETFTEDQVRTAPATSGIEKARTLFNQVQNLLLGNHLHYNVSRLPFLRYRAAR